MRGDQNPPQARLCGGGGRHARRTGRTWGQPGGQHEIRPGAQGWETGVGDLEAAGQEPEAEGAAGRARDGRFPLARSSVLCRQGATLALRWQ